MGVEGDSRGGQAPFNVPVAACCKCFGHLICRSTPGGSLGILKWGRVGGDYLYFDFLAEVTQGIGF
jgi:hypothetical protein